ncbi:MAG: putative toxin-antitoxin system toxin component, PIN family [Bryobacteraceae bacterium]
MVSVTADSNFYVSALNFPGPPARLLAMANAGRIRLDLSDEILAETMNVLRKKFDWPGELIHAWNGRLRTFTNRVTPTERLDVIKHDPPDDRILECAVAANSDYIVSADKDLLRLGKYGNAQIVRVADFLNVLLEKPGQGGSD